MRKLLLPLLALCLALPLCAASGETVFNFSEGTAEFTDKAAETAEWTYPIPLDILRDEADVLRLVNKTNTLDKGYPPNDALHQLADVSVRKTENVEMPARAIADEALVAMFAAATGEGLTLLVESGYRSHGRQAALYERKLAQVGKDDGTVQSPGASEHQTGLAFDIINPAWTKEPYLHERFAETDEGTWLAANCAKYGFIIRYPKDKREITGIRYEPWHLRYVGVEVALYMTAQNLCLEEFTAEYRHALGQYAVLTGNPSLLN